MKCAARLRLRYRWKLVRQCEFIQCKDLDSRRGGNGLVQSMSNLFMLLSPRGEAGRRSSSLPAPMTIRFVFRRWSSLCCGWVS